jgi:Uncharacterized conserved protein
MSDRTIIVKGMGNVRVNPDLIIITMNLTSTRFDYSQALERSAIKLESLRTALISIGYEGKSLKTLDFKIKAEYDSYKDSTGNWKQKFTGYSCSHDLKLEFDFDMRRLDETLNAISSSVSPSDLQISFSVKDKNAVQTDLLESAVSNATDKAIILAKASGVTLGAIRHIDYSWSELRLYSNTLYEKKEFLECRHASLEIEPEEIEAKDTVTMIWEIQ